MAQTPNIDLRTNYSKNYLINGDMRLAQRGTSFASAGSGQYSVDRFVYTKSGAMVHTITQDSDAPTAAQSGYLFQNSVRLNLTTPVVSLAAGDNISINQYVEGYNWTNLAQKPFTLSFWVKATLPGIYCVAFRNSGADRAYVAEYTINLTNTWEYKTITVSASPSAGTWNYVNGIGLDIRWTVASGSTFYTTANAWQTGNFIATANQVNGVNTGSTDFRITGAQLNEGSQALPFRLFGEDVPGEIRAAQRYYEKSYDLTVNPGSSTTDGLKLPYAFIANGQNIATWIQYKVIKRANPSISSWDNIGNPNRTTAYNGGNAVTHNINSGSGTWSAAAGFATVGLYGNEANLGATTGSYSRHWAADAEL